MLAAAATKFQLSSVIEYDDVVAVKVLLQLANSFNVDNRRTMDSEEPGGIKLLFHLIHGFTQQVALASDLELNVVVFGLDVINLLSLQKENSPTGFDQQPGNM